MLNLIGWVRRNELFDEMFFAFLIYRVWRLATIVSGYTEGSSDSFFSNKVGDVKTFYSALLNISHGPSG